MIQKLVRQRELLKLEYEYEKEQFQRQTEAMGVERKVRRIAQLIAGEGAAEIDYHGVVVPDIDAAVAEACRIAKDS